MNTERIREIVAKQCEDQGVPLTVTEPAALRRIADLLSRPPGGVQ